MMPHNIFDDHAFPGSRPQPWRPALGEGSAAINHARFLDALAGRRHATTPKRGKIVGGLPVNDYHRQQRAEHREQERVAAEMRLRAPGASNDKAAYMRDRRIVFGRGGKSGHRGPQVRAYDPTAVAAAATKRRATWDAKLGRTTRINHHRKPAP
jgi:hypothetical protein